MIDIAGEDKAEVAAKLYNAARPQGTGFLQFKPGDMTVSQMRELVVARVAHYLEHGCTKEKADRVAWQFDYLAGRVMKVSLDEDSFDERLYDRDNGPGAAAAALARSVEP